MERFRCGKSVLTSDRGVPNHSGCFPLSVNFLFASTLDTSLPGIRSLKLRRRSVFSVDSLFHDRLVVSVIQPSTWPVQATPHVNPKLYYGVTWSIYDFDISATVRGPFHPGINLTANSIVILSG